MNEDYVSFELAKKLKEKGYPQDTSGSWNMTSSCYAEDGRFYKGGCITDVNRSYTSPTISQVLKWLREKKIYIDIPSFPTYANKDRVAFAVVVKHGSDGYSMKEYESTQSYSKWNEAALVGIEYALDNLI